MTALTFASGRQEQEYGQLDARNPQLKRVIDGAAEHAFTNWAWIPCVNDIFRTAQESVRIDAASVAGLGMGRPAGSTSPHCVWQAADFSVRGVSPAHVKALTEWCNSTWVYNPSDARHSVALSSPHGTGAHLHIQVCPATRLRA